MIDIFTTIAAISGGVGIAIGAVIPRIIRSITISNSGQSGQSGKNERNCDKNSKENNEKYATREYVNFQDELVVNKLELCRSDILGKLEIQDTKIDSLSRSIDENKKWLFGLDDKLDVLLQKIKK